MRTRTGTKGEVQSQRLNNDRSVLANSGYECALVLSLGLLWSLPLLQPEPPPRRRAGCALHLGSCRACSQLLSFRELKLRSKLRHLVDRIVLLGTGQVADAGSASKVFRHFGGRFVESL